MAICQVLEGVNRVLLPISDTAEKPTGLSSRQMCLVSWGRCGSDSCSVKLLSVGVSQFSVSLFSVEYRPVPFRSEERPGAFKLHGISESTLPWLLSHGHF